MDLTTECYRLVLPPKRVLLTKQATKQNLANEGNAETFREIVRSEQTRSLRDNCFKLFVNSFSDLLYFGEKIGPIYDRPYI